MYLVERGLGEWARGEPVKIPAWKPSAISILNFANWLVPFLQWCWSSNRDTREGDGGLIFEFQDDLLRGDPDRDLVGLAPKTVNSYVDVAEDYLHWLASKGLRGELNIPTTTKTVPIRSATIAATGRVKRVVVRRGRVRVKPSRLAMPKREDVNRWLEERYAISHTIGLMSELVLYAGPRRESVVDWRVDTLPEKWRVTNPSAHPDDHLVAVVLRFGVKGPDLGRSSHGDKTGPEYDLKIPLWLAHKLNDYRENVRPKLMKPFIRGGKNLEEQRERSESPHLFRKADGDRLTGKVFYHAWRKGTIPMTGWCPHLGRHWWACMLLWTHYERHRESLRRELRASPDALYSWAESTIRMHIQSGLNHAQYETSLIYLHWFADMVGIPLPERFQSAMH